MKSERVDFLEQKDYQKNSGGEMVNLTSALINRRWSKLDKMFPEKVFLFRGDKTFVTDPFTRNT